MESVIPAMEQVFDGDDDYISTDPSGAPLADTTPTGDQSQQAADDTATEQQADETQAQQTEGDQQKPEEKPADQQVQETPEDKVRTDWRAETFKTRGEVQRLETELEELKAQLGQKEDEFVGLQVSGSVDQWDCKTQYEGLPERVFDKLTQTVFDTPGNLDSFVEQVIEDPEGHADSLELLRAATGRIAERSFQRPFAEVAKIMTAVRGMTPEQVDRLLTGERTEQRGQPLDTGAPGTKDGLFRMAKERNVDVEDEATAGFLNDMDQAYRGMQLKNSELQTQMDSLNAKLNELTNQTSSKWKQETETLQGDMRSQVDQRAEQLITTAIEEELKGRLPEGSEDRDEIVEFIAARVERALAKDPKATSALDLARDIAVDFANPKRELHPKVLGQLRSYGVKVNAATKTAVASLLNRTVVPQAKSKLQTDAAKQNGKTLVGAASGAVSQGNVNPRLAELQNQKLNSTDDVSNWVIAMDRARHGQ